MTRRCWRRSWRWRPCRPPGWRSRLAWSRSRTAGGRRRRRRRTWSGPPSRRPMRSWFFSWRGLDPPLGKTEAGTGAALRAALELDAVRRDSTLDSGKADLGGDRQDGDDDRGADLALAPVDREGHERVAERDHAHQRRDRGGGDDIDGRGLDAAEDQRQRERQLDRADDLAVRQTHPAGGVDGVAIGLAYPHVGVGEDRRDREQRERQRHVQELGARGEERDEQRDQRHARDRPPDVGRRDRQERALAGVAEDQPERERDHQRQGHRDAADLQVLPDQRQVVAAADRRSALVLARGEDEADRVAEIAQGGEGLYHRAAARVQGVRTFWMPSTMRSSTTASSTHSPPATTTLER